MSLIDAMLVVDPEKRPDIQKVRVRPVIQAKRQIIDMVEAAIQSG